MNKQSALFEVEFRCHFSSNDEVYKALPFLPSCLKGENAWVDTFYGLELFKSGQLLRVSDIVINNGTRYYLSWKGPDIGKFANIFANELFTTKNDKVVQNSTT